MNRVGGGSAKLTRAFEYDALYRLLQATGREAGGYATSSTPWKDDFYIPDNSAGNTHGYTRQYKYDLLGNILQVAHNGGTGNTWNRSFNDFDTAPAAAYASANTLTKVKFGSTSITSSYDACGNQIAEGSSRHFEWDAADQLRFFWEGTNGGTPTQAAVYVYAGGERVKKVVWKPGGADAVVSTYIDGGFEHRYKLSTGGSRSEAHNEVHVMDGRSRVAVLRVGTAFSGDSTPAVRYHLDDHLGNACFTLSDTGALISREEYFPFGETAFGSHAKKRYRYCGKERDEESGLYYYGARYYAPWCCRFVSIDPLAGAYAAWSPYCYALDNPVMMNDPSGMAPEGGGNKDGSSFGKDSTTGETFLKRELDGVTISATRILKNAVASTPMQSAQFGWDKDGKAKAGYTIPATDNLGSILEPGYQIRGRKPGASNVNPYHAGIAINMTKNPYALVFVLVGALVYHELTKNPGQSTVYTIPQPGRTGVGVQASDGETQPASTARPQTEARPQIEPKPPGVPMAIGETEGTGNSDKERQPIRVALGVYEDLPRFAKSQNATPYTRWEAAGLIPDHLKNIVSQEEINRGAEDFDLVLDAMIANPLVEFYFNRSLANGSLITNEMMNKSPLNKKVTVKEYKKMLEVVPYSRVKYFRRDSNGSYFQTIRE